MKELSDKSTSGTTNDTSATESKGKKEVFDTRLKYQHLINNYKIIRPCTDKYKPVRGIAYRFVKTELITEDDFFPLAMVENDFTSKRRLDSEEQKCMMCAISLYNSAENAIKKLKYLSGRKRSRFTGNLIALGLLDEKDGVASTPKDDGHYSFFEYINSNIYLNFEVFTYTA